MSRKIRTTNQGFSEPFASNSELECRTRIADLIAQSDDGRHGWWFRLDYWLVSRRSRKSSAGDGGVWFSIAPVTRSGDYEPFPEPFASFMKLMVCLYDRRSDDGFAATQLQTLVAAGRYLCRELAEVGYDAVCIESHHLSAAALKARAVMGTGSKNIGSKLAFIGREVSRRGLVLVPFTWTNPNKSVGKHNRIGHEADRRRRERLISPEVLDALAEISATGTERLAPQDLVLQRCLDLLVCGGFRINEALTLPENPIVEEPFLDAEGAQLLDRFGKPATKMHLRYWPEKRGHQVTRLKPIPTAMQDIARRAITEIQAISAPFRAVARYQAAHRGRTLLKPPYDTWAEPLPTLELAKLLGFRPVVGREKHSLQGAASQFIRRHKLPLVSGAEHCVDRRDVENHLYGRSDQGNVLRLADGVQDVADSLFLISTRFMHRSMDAGLNGTVELVTDAQINVYLTGLKNGSQRSILERLDYRDDSGEFLRGTSHQFRHWLSTLADESGFLGVEQARWMGRATLSHNSAYDHVTPVERAREVRERTESRIRAAGPVAEIAVRINDPVRRSEFVAAAVPTAHVTEVGLCVHDWDAAPCPKHGSCVLCEKLRIVKGRQTDRTAAVIELGDVEDMLRTARIEDAEGTYGASRWVKSQVRRKLQLERIIATHDDPTKPDGMIVQLSRLSEQEVEDRVALELQRA